MNTATSDKLMTIEEFHALPEDEEVERQLIRGVLWEEPMTRRNKWHTEVGGLISFFLNEWLGRQPKPRGKVFSGEIGCDLPEVDTSVAIDVAYFAPETIAAQDDDAPYLVGVPVLAVEILSPSDTTKQVNSKIQSYQAAGVPLVWIVDTDFHYVTVHRLAEPPRTYSGDDELTADPHLPGFAVPVSKLFER